jgi:hypothetical protein
MLNSNALLMSSANLAIRELDEPPKTISSTDEPPKTISSTYTCQSGYLYPA